MSVSIAGDGTLTGIDADASGLLAEAGGIGTNVASVTKTDVFSTTSGTFTPVTGLSVTITPTSASSKILVIGMLSGSPGDNDIMHARLVRDSTPIAIGDADGSTTRATTNLKSGGSTTSVNNSAINNAIVTVDSPATTSATTYAIEVMQIGGAVLINRSGRSLNNSQFARTASSLIAIEVAA